MFHPNLETVKAVPAAHLFSIHCKTQIVTGATGGIALVSTDISPLAEPGAGIVSIQIPNDLKAEHLREKVERQGDDSRSLAVT